jgi:hypothetical protein
MGDGRGRVEVCPRENLRERTETLKMSDSAPANPDEIGPENDIELLIGLWVEKVADAGGDADLAARAFHAELLREHPGEYLAWADEPTWQMLRDELAKAREARAEWQRRNR